MTAIGSSRIYSITGEYSFIRESVGGSPLSQGLPPLENSPQDCFQFTPCPSSSKAIRARGAGKRVSPPAGGDQRLRLWTSPAGLSWISFVRAASPPSFCFFINCHEFAAFVYITIYFNFMYCYRIGRGQAPALHIS